MGLHRLTEELALVVQQDAEPRSELEVQASTSNHVILTEVTLRRVW